MAMNYGHPNGLTALVEPPPAAHAPSTALTSRFNNVLEKLTALSAEISSEIAALTSQEATLMRVARANRDELRQKIDQLVVAYRAASGVEYGGELPKGIGAPRARRPYRKRGPARLIASFDEVLAALPPAGSEKGMRANTLTIRFGAPANGWTRYFGDRAVRTGAGLGSAWFRK